MVNRAASVPCADCPFRAGTAAQIDANSCEEGLGEFMVSMAKNMIKKHGIWHCHKTLGDRGQATPDTRECWGSPRYRRALPLILARKAR